MDEGVKAHGEVRLRGESPGNAEGEADLFPALAEAPGGSQTDVVDLGVGAPLWAASDGNFEFAGEIVKLRIAREFFINREHDRRDIRYFARIDAGERAAGNVAGDIAASAGGAEANGAEPVKNFRNGFDADPVKLNVLADGDIGDAVAVFGRERSNRTDLFRGEETIGNTDADHEVRDSFAFTTRATDDALTVSLSVDTPRAEIRGEPFVRDGFVAEASKFADLVEVLPGIFVVLEALDALSLSFFAFGHWVHSDESQIAACASRAAPLKLG